MNIDLCTLNWFLRWTFLRFGRCCEADVTGSKLITSAIYVSVCHPQFLYRRKPKLWPAALWGQRILIHINFDNEI